MKSNGCNEDGWDLFEEQTRQEFEYYACRQGYSLERDKEWEFFYAEERTEDAWRMYHQGHVDGRGWSKEMITLDAKTAYELLDNPTEASETLKEMLRLK